MKKAFFFLTVVCLSLLFGSCAGAPAEPETSTEPQVQAGMQSLTGRALVFEGGSCAILTEQNEVIVMADVSTAGGLFDGLHTGDRIAVTHGPIRETYPGQTDVDSLEILEHGSEDAIPTEPLELLESMGWTLAVGPAGEMATEPVLTAVTEPYSGEIPSVPPGDTRPEPYLHLNDDRIEPLEMPDHVTVIAEFREQMGDTPVPVPSEQIAALVRQINALELEGYDVEQSEFLTPGGGGYLVRLYYGDQVVTFNLGTDWMISVQYPDDPQARWFMDKSGNFDALIQLIYPVLAA